MVVVAVFYKDALARGADVYITGDIYYHTAQDMLSGWVTGIDPGHYIEVLFVEKILHSHSMEGWKMAGQSILYLVKHRPILPPYLVSEAAHENEGYTNPGQGHGRRLLTG